MILDPILDIFRGKAVTIPPLDGAFRPNTRLDDAKLFARLPEADNLATRDGALLASSGNTVFALTVGGEPSPVSSYASPVTALAISPAGEIAVGLENGNLFLGGAHAPLPANVRCITALAYDPDGALWLANGSAAHAPSDWATDLMRHGSSGSIWKRETGGGFSQAADGLAFPYGLLPAQGGVVVSESWRHRLVRIDASGHVSTVASKLPGYPARLSRTFDGGAWLAIFAPRNRLIEFVLQETGYLEDMIDTVPSQFWIAPAMSSNRSFLEPLQCGGIKTMGIHKPWSPSRSYGMAVRLDAGLNPLFSLHSRANGTRHGTCSVVEMGENLFVASRGGDCVLALDTGEL
ncbi:MAG: hypothetical protein QM744_10825 [Mesorhizobium sp.]